MSRLRLALPIVIVNLYFAFYHFTKVLKTFPRLASVRAISSNPISGYSHADYDVDVHGGLNINPAAATISSFGAPLGSPNPRRSQSLRRSFFGRPNPKQDHPKFDLSDFYLESADALGGFEIQAAEVKDSILGQVTDASATVDGILEQVSSDVLHVASQVRKGDRSLDDVMSSQSTGSSNRVVASGLFGWITDAHLDLFYDPWMTQDTYCRNESTLMEIHRQLAWLKKVKSDRLQANHHLPRLKGTFQLAEVNSAFVERNQIAREALLPGYHGRYGCDPPASMVWSAYLSMREAFLLKPIDFLLVTGDLAAHYWTKRINAYGRLQSLEVATWLMQGALSEDLKLIPNCTIDSTDQIKFMRSILDPDYEGREACVRPLQSSQRRISKNLVPQAIFCPGNNDMRRDYIPEFDSPWNALVEETWAEFIPPSERERFRKYMYYSTPLERVPDLYVACLNTMWWGKKSKSTSMDPAGQFAWLQGVLEKAASEHRQVLLVGHIAPTHSLIQGGTGTFCLRKEWHDKYNERYHELITTFRSTVAGQYYGHFHSDEFRLQVARNASGKTEPTGLVMINPGLCLNHGENPGWRLNSYKVIEQQHDDDPTSLTSKFVLTDYDQMYSKLYGSSQRDNFGTFDPFVLPKFLKEYSGAARFNVTEFSEVSMFRNFWEPTTQSISDAWVEQILDFTAVQGRRPPALVLKCLILEDWQKVGVRRCVQSAIEKIVHSKDRRPYPISDDRYNKSDDFLLVVQ